MRESVISRKFGKISDAFLHWTSGIAIDARKDCCRSAALAVFGHAGKLTPSYDLLRQLLPKDSVGFAASLRKRSKLPTALFIHRPATSLHLAKNLGLNVVKPDRHLVRISSALGYQSPDDMCQQLSTVLGEKVCVIDIVFWRFATINARYISTLSGSSWPREGLGSSATLAAQHTRKHRSP